MQNPEVVVFDLGKVLLEFDYALAVRNLSEHCSLSSEELLKLINQSSLLHRYETGAMTTSDFFAEIKKVTKFCKELDAFEPLFGDIFAPIEPMIELNDRLRQQGFRTYIFSNTNDIAVRHIRKAYPFFQNFDAYILSYEHRAMKPDPKIYEVVERETRAEPAEILYIDDRLENVEQGEARGWHTIHHVTPKQTILQAEELLS